jgi:hypothetical protein
MAKPLSTTIRRYYRVVLSVTIALMTVFTLTYISALVFPKNPNGFSVQLVPVWLVSLGFAVICSIVVGLLHALTIYAKDNEHRIQEMLNRR